MKKVILASTSIYRMEQLKRLGVNFESASPCVDEAAIKQQVSDPIELSRELSILKARSVSDQHDHAIVIGGDQVASFNDSILGKPKTKDRAFEQLKSLSGQAHRLITSLAILADGEEYVHTCIATMKMRVLSDEQIMRYIDNDEPLQCCGAYRIEAMGISLFDTIECDDFTSIVGVPLMWTAKTLSQLGVSVP